MYYVWHNYLFILLFQMLATNSGLNRLSSGQRYKKIKNVVAYDSSVSWDQYECEWDPKILKNYIICTSIFKIL